MSSLVIVNMTAKKGSIENTISVLKEIVNKMHNFDGCLSVELVENVFNREYLKLFEKWETIEHQRKFLSLIQSDGLITQLKETLVGDPYVETYETSS